VSVYPKSDERENKTSGPGVVVTHNERLINRKEVEVDDYRSTKERRIVCGCGRCILTRERGL
jgi:hypothetical protein